MALFGYNNCCGGRGALRGAVAAVLLTAAGALAQNPPPVQYYYLPFPEDQVLTALQAIAVNNTQSQYTPKDPIQSYISLAVFANDTVIYYDQWENGFDDDIANPKNIYSAANPGGTQIWGDGNPANGYPPGHADDLLGSGDIIILDNEVVTTTRQAVIDFDGGEFMAK